MRRPRLPRSRRGVLTLLASLIVLAAAIAAGGYFYVKGRTGSVYPHPNAQFVKEPTPPPKRKPPPVSKFVWARYGYDLTHTRYFPAPESMRPPYRKVWEAKETGLLEFPPSMSGERIFQLADDGVLSAINVKTGHIIWSKKLGALSASTPAVLGGTVYATILSRAGGSADGRVVAVRAKNGNVIWSRNLPSRSESSPTVANGKVIFGSEAGTVFALNASNGKTIWTYQAAGAVKASPTLYRGILYFGDYAGDLQAVSERTGHRVWVSGSEGAPLGSGTFYSTAAVAYGRIYLGNTDGRIYAYEASSGRLDWAVQTGAYVYGSPAVTNAPGLGPTVYEGSYDGSFYAINARTGAIEWRHAASGPISGGATIIGKVVYFSNLHTYMTTGLNTTTGKLVFQVRQGAFDPGISDGKNLYVDGYNTLLSYEPVGAKRSGSGGGKTRGRTGGTSAGPGGANGSTGGTSARTGGTGAGASKKKN